MKDELIRKLMKKFPALRTNTYTYLTDDSDENEKAKHKKCVIKQKLKFEDYKHCLKATPLENKINQLEKNKLDVYNLRESHK